MFFFDKMLPHFGCISGMCIAKDRVLSIPLRFHFFHILAMSGKKLIDKTTSQTLQVSKETSICVLMQIVATGVCHTDLYHLFEGMHKDGFPAVLGHEGAGIVESVGPGVTEFQPGRLNLSFVCLVMFTRWSL